MDQLTKSAHFLTMKSINKLLKLAQLFMDEIVRLQRVPMPIILDRNPRLNSNFWGGSQEEFEMK